jgi:hypothetical protein
VVIRIISIAVVPGGVNRAAYLPAADVTQVQPNIECRAGRQRKSYIYIYEIKGKKKKK